MENMYTNKLYFTFFNTGLSHINSLLRYDMHDDIIVMLLGAYVPGVN